MQNPITVPNAGLVLPWPFLQRLFEALELMEDARFRSEAAQQRAASLLGFIASGTTDPAGLALPNLLCGLPPEHPTLAAFDPSHEELQLTKDMLDAVTQNWPGLKATSRDGLRQTFLMRDGQLQSDTLEVINGPYDMLLDRLTWTISTVSLPWMVAPLFVKWC